MTRFARAKGSKASNERVPDEATPWNVMKMQLEDSQAVSQPVAKPKTARQLLAEKDEPFYHNTTGNVNHEWAAFDDVDVNQKKSGKNKSGKVLKNDDNKKKEKKMKKSAKLHLANDNDDNKITEVVEKSINRKQNQSPAKNELETVDETRSKKKKKEKRAGTEFENVESPKADENGVDDASNSNDDKSGLKSKKHAKKSKKSKANANNVEEAKQSENVTSEGGESQKVEVASFDKSSNVEGNSEKLSKRQKRNKKKQLKIASDKNEAKVKEVEEVVEKKGGPEGFDVLGNEWSNEVKFGRQNNPQESLTSGDNEAEKIKNLDKRKHKLKTKKVEGNGKEEGEDGEEKQNDNTSPENSKSEENGDNVQGSKAQKRKGGKNDGKEYKRRKPDEGVIKMIMNGNEVEVVKYDGFPVKKEDAERLKELKKNMIIKGIPRSEINIAIKLERRKAEKALTRERKRVCFHCRKSGHNLSDCPELGRDEAGSGICFKCGSAEHTHFECKVVKGQEFRHASCFICREQGHIARQCPDNPKGLYPQGGGCKICGDVTHLKKDCPDVIKEKEETNITADKIVGSQLESLEEDEVQVRSHNDDNKTRSKVVKF